MAQVPTNLNRLSRFPWQNKRELEAEADQGGQKQQKYIKSVPVQDLKPLQGGRIPLQKEVSNLWDQYQEIFKMKQVGPGHFVHLKDDMFLEMIVKEVKVHSQTWLSRLSASSHKNIIHLWEALYHNSAIYFVYEVLDVSLAQVFVTSLGQLKAYKVAAFCYEILAGIEYIHNDLNVVHSDLSSKNVLLSTDRSIKIGMNGSRNVCHSQLIWLTTQQILEQACWKV